MIGGMLRAESRKLSSLPAVRYAALGTAVIGMLLALALAKIALDEGTGRTAAAVAAQVVRYVQAGMIVLGVFAVAQEYAGKQISTTFVAMPRRATLLAAKVLAAAMACAVTMLGTVAASWATAAVVLGDADPAGAWLCAGAVVYGVLLGLLAFAVALLVRHLTGALVTVLALIYLAPTLLHALGEQVRWLPGTAGAELYAPGDAVLTATTGALVLAGWAVAAGAVGGLRFVRADA